MLHINQPVSAPLAEVEQDAGTSRSKEKSSRALPDIAVPAFREDDAVAVCEGVIDLITVFFNVSGRQLRSPKRTSPPVARVRQIGMYIAHVSLGLKMSWVGTGFGRDRSTVMYACHAIEDLRDDEEFELIMSRVESLVQIAFTLNGGPRFG